MIADKSNVRGDRFVKIKEQNSFGKRKSTKNQAKEKLESCNNSVVHPMNFPSNDDGFDNLSGGKYWINLFNSTTTYSIIRKLTQMIETNWSCLNQLKSSSWKTTEFLYILVTLPFPVYNPKAVEDPCRTCFRWWNHRYNDTRSSLVTVRKRSKQRDKLSWNAWECSSVVATCVTRSSVSSYNSPLHCSAQLL